MVPYIILAYHTHGSKNGHALGASSAKKSLTYLRTISNILMTCWLSGERSLPTGLLVKLANIRQLYILNNGIIVHILCNQLLELSAYPFNIRQVCYRFIVDVHEEV